MTQEIKNLKATIEALRELYNEQLDTFRFEEANETYNRLAKANNKLIDLLMAA